MTKNTRNPRRLFKTAPLLFESLEDRALLSVSTDVLPVETTSAEVVSTPTSASSEPIDLSAAVSDDADDATNPAEESDVEDAKTLKILFIGNSLSEDARTFVANAAAQYSWLDPDNVKIGSLYQGGRSVGYFANCARGEQGVALDEYDYDHYSYTNDTRKDQVDAPNNGYGDATKNFCEYYEWNGISWDQLKGEENLGEKTIEFAMSREDWDVVLIEGFYCDLIDGSVENGFDGTLTSDDPAKEGASYNLRESFSSNLKYLSDYLRSLDSNGNMKVGFFLPTVHHETQPNWLDDDPYASMMRTAEYVEENLDFIDFIVPPCTAVENAKTTFLTLLTNDDAKDTVLEWIRRDAIHSSYFLARELVAMGIVDSVLQNLYGDEIDVREGYSPDLKLESPVFGNLPLEYMDILQTALDAARENPRQITQLTTFSTQDPAIAALNAAKLAADAGGDVRACVDAAKDALSDRQWSDMIVNYGVVDGIATLSFSYGYTTSEAISIVLNAESAQDASDAPVVPREDQETPSTIVNSLADVVDPTDGFITLREAVCVYAKDGDTVSFDESLAGGTILLGGDELSISKTLTIDASALYDRENDVPGITIDAQNASRIFNIESDAVALKALTLVNASSEDFGGAIYVAIFSSLTVEDSIFHDNAALNGGALYADGQGTLTIENSTFFNNEAEIYGGAICAHSSSTVTIDASTFHNNAAGYSGGALRTSASTLTIAASVLRENTAEYGGAIDAASSSTTRIENSELTGNSAVKYGGAMYAAGKNTTHTIVSSIVSDNAANNGGGLYVSGYDTTLTLDNSALYGNKVAREGAAVETKYSALTLYSVTIAGNTSEADAGAIYAYYTSLTVYNSIVAQNEGKDIVRKSGTSSAYNVVSSMKAWGNYDAVFVVYAETLPLFTDAANNDFTLAEDSQALDRGDDFYLHVKVDLNGNNRVMGAGVDLGAFERLVAETPSTIVDSFDDTIDPYDGLVTLREALTLYAEDGDLVSFDPFLAGGTILLENGEFELAASVTIDASALCDACSNTHSLTIDARSGSRIFNVLSGNVEINGLRLTGGYAEEGGAIYVADEASLSVVNCVLVGNEALFGGAIASYGSTTIDASQLVGNVAEYAGAIFATGDVPNRLTVMTSTICQNESAFVGGALLLYGVGADVFNTTIASNVSSGSGAVHVYSADEPVDVVFYNSIVAANDGGDVFCENEANLLAFDVLTSFEDWSNDDGGVYLYDADLPLFADAENGDYSLADASQAIDCGNFEGLVSAYDLAGAPRIANLFVDLGAYEKQSLSLDYAFENGAATVQADLRWNVVDGAESYSVMISYDGGGVWEPVAENVVGLAATIAGLEEGTSYVTLVKAFDENGTELDAIQSAEFVPEVVRTLDIVLRYDQKTQQTTLTWDPIDHAERYLIKYSKNGGERWTVLAQDVSDSSMIVDNVKVGVSYMFRVYGIAANGALLSTVEEATLAPINVDGSVNPSFTVTPGPVGSLVVVTLSGAPNASADVRWYYVTENGDVEIEEAAGLLEYVLPDSPYNVRIVAKGVGDSQGSEAELTVVDTIAFDYDPYTRRAVMTWDPVEGAANYLVKFTKNNGEVWTTLAKTSEPSTIVSGLYVTRSYSFQVYALASNGERLSTIQGATFAPIMISASVVPARVGKTISVALSGTDNVTADVKWYYVTENGDVEIEEAAGLWEYTPRNTSYSVRIVATGTNDSEGSRSELEIVDTLGFSYDASIRKATITWDEVPGAVSYTIKISRDGGETWQTIGRGLTERSAIASGVYVGKSYLFQVVGVAETGMSLPLVQTSTLAPLSVNAFAYSSEYYGKTISLTLQGDDSVSGETRWYYVDESGDVEIEEAAGLTEYAPDDLSRDVKIVVTGTGVSKGITSSALITSGIDVEYDPVTRYATLTWDEVPGAVSYTVKISKDSGVTWSTIGSGITELSAIAKGLYAGKTYSFQVSSNGGTAAMLKSSTFAPIAVNASVTSGVNGTRTIVATTSGAENAAAELRWFYVAEDGDVEIEEAAGLSQYTTDSAYDVKIVATGLGDSRGSTSTALVADTLAVEYDAATRSATLSWVEVDGATSYTVKISKNNGETWTTYLRGVTDTTAVVKGIYAGKTTLLQVLAVGSTISTVQGAALSPLRLNVSVSTSSQGKTISATLADVPNATADVRWYYVTENGDLEIEDALGASKRVFEDLETPVKVVATGYDISSGTVSYATFSNTVSVEYDPDSQTAAISWDEVEGASSYSLKYRVSGSGTTSLSVSDSSAVLTGLEPGLSCEITVVATVPDGSPYFVVQNTTYVAPVENEDEPDDEESSENDPPETTSDALLETAFADFFNDKRFEEI